jgi:hypothetical protein
VDSLTLADFGGWKTLAMVTRYAHPMPGRLREGIGAARDLSAGSGESDDLRNRPGS